MRFKAFRLGRFGVGPIWFGLAMMATLCPVARAVEHVTLKNGFELDCVRREVIGDKVRLYFADKASTVAEDSNYMDVAADSVVRVETMADIPQPVATTTPVIMNKTPAAKPAGTTLTQQEMHE